MSLIGKKVRNLKILQAVGHGGMGQVYAAFDETLERKVALKVILEGRRLGAAAKARFLREARILSRLDHPHVCRIHDYIVEEDRDYLVLEWIEGVDLQEALRGSLEPAAKMKIALQIAEALSAAHTEGVLHRDLKPGNVMLTEQGDVKVLDFGLARSTAPADAPTLEAGVAAAPFDGDDDDDETQLDQTATMLASFAGTIIGTPRYMSPEQGRGEPLTLASDMYSYGLLLQHLFTGADPYGGVKDVAALMERVRGGRTVPVTGVDPDLERLIERLKDPAPARRPTAVETIERLRWIVDKPRRRLRRLAGVAVTLLVLVAGFKYTVDLRRERREADRRRGQAEELIGFMLGDLREKLSPIGRLDVLDDVGDRALDYFDTLPEKQLTDEERFRLAQAMWQIGEVRIDQGQAEAALEAFLDSRSRIEALLARRPDYPPWLMGLGTAHFWVGSVHFYQGDLDAAEKEFLAYMNVAQRLVRLRPDDDKAMLELGYAHTNLAALYEERGDVESAQHALQDSIAIKRQLVDADPTDRERLASLANSLDWLAVTQTTTGDLRGTLVTQSAAFDLRSKLVELDANDTDAARMLSVAHNLLADTLECLGRDDEALDHMREDMKISRRLAEHDPDNASWRRSLGRAELRLGRFLLDHGALDRARSEVDRALQAAVELHALDPANQEWQKDVAASRDVRAAVLLRQGRGDEALRTAEQAVDDGRAFLETAPDDAVGRTQLSHALLTRGEALRARGREADARESWREGLELLDPSAQAPDALELRSRLLVLTGRKAEGAAVADDLRRRGYRRADFLDFLRRHGLES